MGALTLKSFPFELRGWDLEKLESIDPTDGFGSNTRVYITQNRIIQIEPDFKINNFFGTSWLTDKGRQFFDGIFFENKKLGLKHKDLLGTIKNVIQTLYMFEHCRTKQSKNNFFIIIFENLSLELLTLLTIISQNQSFLKLRRVENVKINNDLETNFQLNFSLNKVKLKSSTLCLLISNNPRYEGYQLNLNLRQRFQKGNFKCLNIGSLIDLTFPVLFLGSNFHILKTIAEGNNLICQEFKYSKNPLLIFNNEIFKRNAEKNNLELIKIFKYTNIFSKSWNGLNILNSSLNEVGTQSLNKFVPLNEKDLINFSSLYFLNVTINNVSNLKKIAKLKLLHNSSLNPLFLDQNSKINNNIEIYNNLNNITKFKKYIYLSSSMFYENEETFINTEGLIKRTNKITFKQKTKTNWEIVRRVFKNVQINLKVLNIKNNNLIFFNAKKIIDFKNYIHFHYQATQALTNANFFLNTKNENFILFNTISNFKQKRIKLKNTKLKYWLDDFFNGGKDGYSQYSLILTNCSKILRTKSTNFF